MIFSYLLLNLVLDIFKKTMSYPPPPTILVPKLLSIMQKIKTAYQLWYEYYQILPKCHRNTIGQKIDSLFTDTIEAISIATFLSKEEKPSYIKLAIRKINTLTIFILILWENKSLDNKNILPCRKRLMRLAKFLGVGLDRIKNKTLPTKQERNDVICGQRRNDCCHSTHCHRDHCCCSAKIRSHSYYN
jgi:hypothetical protein